jgi:cholera toxin transcriptional activator
MNKYLIGGRFLFDPYNNSLTDQQEPDDLVRLGANESRALCLLIEEPGAIIHRNRLHDYVWREQGFEVDDSSLTQAISTLRKALKDSTKSPAYIKTVPKRGYQMIAPVSVYLESIGDQTHTECDNPYGSPSSTPFHSSSILENNTNTDKNLLISLVAIVIAIVIPCLVLFILPPKTDHLHTIMKVDNLQIVTTKQNPPLEAWKPLITRCVTQYLSKTPSIAKPEMVVVSGGQNAQLWINYIHDKNHTASNLSQKFLTEQKDGAQLCQ